MRFGEYLHNNTATAARLNPLIYWEQNRLFWLAVAKLLFALVFSTIKYLLGAHNYCSKAYVAKRGTLFNMESGEHFTFENEKN